MQMGPYIQNTTSCGNVFLLNFLMHKCTHILYTLLTVFMPCLATSVRIMAAGMGK